MKYSACCLGSRTNEPWLRSEFVRPTSCPWTNTPQAWRLISAMSSQFNILSFASISCLVECKYVLTKHFKAAGSVLTRHPPPPNCPWTWASCSGQWAAVAAVACSAHDGHEAPREAPETWESRQATASLYHLAASPLPCSILHDKAGRPGKGIATVSE